MALRLNGATSGYVELNAPAVAGSNTLTLPNGNGSSGQVLSTDGSGALSWSDHDRGPAARATNSSSQSLADGTWTKLNVDTESFDTDGCFASSRFTPNKAGIYLFNAMAYLDYSAGSPNRRGIRFYRNGSAYVSDVQTSPSPSWGMVNLSAMASMNGTTDYMEVYIYFSGATSGQVAASGLSVFEGFYVRPV